MFQNFEMIQMNDILIRQMNNMTVMTFMDIDIDIVRLATLVTLDF